MICASSSLFSRSFIFDRPIVATKVSVFSAVPYQRTRYGLLSNRPVRLVWAGGQNGWRPNLNLSQ